MNRPGPPPGDRFDLAGQVAIVTGGGTGIGRATALVLSRYGATVVLASRRVGDLERVAAEVGEGGGTAVVMETDVSDPSACAALIDDTVAQLGGLDILVNNAGGSRSRTDGEWPADDWDRMIDVNLRSVWLLSRAAAPVMAKRGGGAIVNVASAAALTPRPMHAPYGVAKAGVIHLTSILAAEFGTAGVRVNCVAPGLVKSEGFERAMRGIGRDPDAQGDRVLVGRPGDTEEIAYPILFLVSRAASYVHGETLYVGGGPRYWSPQ
ncbi:MAG TPA: SDR family oxidoreductase [Acidimicrobiales bacterium]|jgi:NAD(P)-dependent dehydrogenase (short-subunit alcohol dehydrogenase family)|nr:SDR family oxidoreductase [Acidimicrobiales bacterium]